MATDTDGPITSTPRDPSHSEQQPLLGGSQADNYGVSSTAQTAVGASGDGGVDHEERGQAQQGTFKRNLGAVEAFAIVISIVIGSGVFTSPGSIDTNVPSPGAALVIWLVGGILAWTGASTLAELGTAIPGEGGFQLFQLSTDTGESD